MSELRPPEPRELPPRRLAARRDHLLHEVRAPRGRRWRPRGRRALLLLPIGAVLAGGAVAATQLLDSSAPTDLVRVQCYERATYDAPHREASADLLGLRGPRPGPQSATRMCERLWTRGELGGGGAAPALQACIYRARVAVFPGGPGTCESLRLERASPGFERAQRRTLAYFDRIAALLQRCGDPKAISRQIDRIVRRRGADPAHFKLRNRPGRNCGPALPRRAALKVAMFAGLTSNEFQPPAAMGCVESFGGVAKAPSGTNCNLGLLGPGRDCLDGSQAERIVRRALDRHGLSDWNILVVPPESPSKRFCYVLSRVYPSRHEVRVRSVVDG